MQLGGVLATELLCSLKVCEKAAVQLFAAYLGC